jgi:glycosyltransferase involved in cell wall biosynthesis
MKLSIIVPCYNEADNLPAVFDAFAQAVGARQDVELILVNNGSTDGSATAFLELLARPSNRFARVVNVPQNKGYGFGILAGLREAKGQFLAWTHADLQTDPADVLAGYDKLESHPQSETCLLRGVRRGRPLVDKAFSVCMSIVASVALGSRLYDINAQPKIFHRSLLVHMDDAPWDFSLDLYLLFLANRIGLTVIDFPVKFGVRQHGQAKGGGSLRLKLKLTRRTLAFIYALRRRTLSMAAPTSAVAQTSGRLLMPGANRTPPASASYPGPTR